VVEIRGHLDGQHFPVYSGLAGIGDGMYMLFVVFIRSL